MLSRFPKPVASGHGLPKRLFAGVVIGAYRDVDDIRIVGSNESERTLKGSLQVRHVDVTGKLLNSWESEMDIPTGGVSRLLDLPGQYRSIGDRTQEAIHVELRSGETVLAEDMLFFCPLAEIAPSQAPLSVELRKTATDTWDLKVGATELCKMVEIETDGLVMFSDNYFPMAPGKSKRIEMRAIDEHRLPTEVLVRALDSESGGWRSVLG